MSDDNVTMNRVKNEIPEDDEIVQMASEIMQANREKMEELAKAQQHQPPTVKQSNNILGYLIRTKKEDVGNGGEEASSPSSTEPPVSLGDEESSKGRFGWITLGLDYFPYIIRSKERYCSVRMIETRILHRFLLFLHQDVCNCTCIRSFFITEAESCLLNEINVKHCDYIFGRELFTCRDLIVRLTDAVDFYRFLETCYRKLTNGTSVVPERCGFIRINEESVVPYTIYDNQKHVPLFYFEGETDDLKQKAFKLEGWYLAYLKFCCKVQGIRNELFEHDYCLVIGLNDIKNYFPPGTSFDDYWPTKVRDSQLLINGKAQPPVGNWTRHPPVPQPCVSPKTPPAEGRLMHDVYALQQRYQPRSTNSRASSTRAFSARACTARLYPPQSRTIKSYFNPIPHPATQPAQTQPTFTDSSTVSTSNYMVLNDIPIIPSQYRQLIPRPSRLPSSRAIRLPPPIIRLPIHPPPQPLMPVHQMNGEVHYESPQNHYPSNDIVDLSNQSRTLGHLLAPEQSPQNNHNSIHNGRAAIHLHRKLIPIADTPTSGNHIPYKMHKAYIESMTVSCINMKPYVYTELLITIHDLTQQLFNNVPIQSCQQVMEVLGIDLYRGNKAQMRVLYENGKCQSINESIPLVPLRLVLEFMPQLKYMLGGLMTSDISSKRLRTS